MWRRGRRGRRRFFRFFCERALARLWWVDVIGDVVVRARSEKR